LKTKLREVISMEVIGVPPTGENILKTLIELLEAQEQIKITYEVKSEK